MAYSITPTAGIDLTSVQVTTPNSANVQIPTFGPLGAEVFGSDGKIYVFAKANASIPASTAVCTVDPATFLVTATGGAYTSPAVALSSGNYAWFAKASV
jgi:hypothetical protein